MGDNSTIEWTNATWNPASGCSKKSRGCKHCYAKRLFPRVYPGRAFENVQTHPDRLDQPLRWRRPRRIFVNSMSDLFHEHVPYTFIDEVFHVMARAPQHVFQILTKREERMHSYLTSAIDGRPLQLGGDITMRMREPLPNVWLGVSVENQEAADQRIPWLLRTPAAVRFLSCEPLLGHIDLSSWPDRMYLRVVGSDGCAERGRIDWVIAGGESGPKAEPMHPDWARSLRQQCIDAKVPFFFKQWGQWIPQQQITTPEQRARAFSYAFGAVARLDDDLLAHKVGKKVAGRELDGRMWEQWPR